MKRESGKVTPEYAESARAYFDSHSDEEIALHQRDLDSLGLSDEGKQAIINNRLHDVAAHLCYDARALSEITKQKPSEQSDAIKELHARLVKGESSSEAHDNEQTDQYLAGRKAR